MRWIFDLPEHITSVHIVVYSAVALVTFFMLSATVGALFAIGFSAIQDDIASVPVIASLLEAFEN